MSKLIEIEHEDNKLNTYMLFVQTAQEVLKYTDTHLRRMARLSTIKLIVLKVLDSYGTMIPSQLADWTNTERHNITTLINRMKRDGLVTTERDRNNKRLVNIKLTNKGRETLNKAMSCARGIVDQVMSSFTEVDAAMMKEKLKILRENAYNGLKYVAKTQKP